MKYIFVLFLFIGRAILSGAASPDSTVIAEKHSVLIVPYNPMMHLSDADQDISMGSEMEMPQMRAAFRDGLIKALGKNFANVHDVRSMNNNFVKGDNDMEMIYHSLLFTTDSVYPVKDPKRFAVKDTVLKRNAGSYKPEKKYINVQIADQMLISDLSEKYNADYIIFLNEFDIKTNFDDCMNLALKIYRRDLKVHYSIFDKSGKQVYGDVVVSHFASNSNDVNEIMKNNFPQISNYVLQSFNRVTQ